ncbi:MAG TPA: NUDIX domain-containing protein [Thermomicrobiaceae bacterium]|nr:NUDIX domain-containing protein [Thermomicrobiaceae bacterium]
MPRDLLLTTDIACFALADRRLQVLLVRHLDGVFGGSWALPGGPVGADEPLDDAAQRILVETTGLWGLYLEQLYTFGDPGRDPRGRAISVAYYAILPPASPGSPPVGVARPGRGVADAAWFPIDRLPGALAFDHGRIAAYARWRLAQKILYTPLAFYLLPDSFTMADLRAVYETVVGDEYDPSNFSRQMLARWDLAPVPGSRDRRTRRPARLFSYIGPREISGGPERPMGLER